MPEKTVREMSELQRRHHSLETKTFRATLMGCIQKVWLDLYCGNADTGCGGQYLCIYAC